MSKPRTRKIPDFTSPSKVLIASHPGRTAALLENGKLKETLQFKNAHAAVDWAETHKVPFFYMPPDEASNN